MLPWSTDTNLQGYGHVAKDMGLVIKLLAIAELNDDNEVAVRVHPTLLSKNHPLSSVRGSFNAVFVESEAAGELMFYGRGAGGTPTASAVLGDLVAVARNLMADSTAPATSDYAQLKVANIGHSKTRYLIRLDVADKPGVLAAVAQTFSKYDVSIQTVRQNGRGEGAELIVMTHIALDSALAATVKELSTLDAVRDVASCIRVEGMGS